MTRLKTRLRDRRRRDAQPAPVVITFDSLVMTAEEAVEAARQSGKIPPGSSIFVFPERITDRAIWERHVQAEHARRERERAAQQEAPT